MNRHIMQPDSDGLGARSAFPKRNSEQLLIDWPPALSQRRAARPLPGKVDAPGIV